MNWSFLLSHLNRIWKRIVGVAIAISLFLGTAIPPARATEPAGNPNQIVYPDRPNLPPDSFATLGDR